VKEIALKEEMEKELEQLQTKMELARYDYETEMLRQRKPKPSSLFNSNITRTLGSGACSFVVKPAGSFLSSELRQRELDHERHKIEYENRVPRNHYNNALGGGGFPNGSGGGGGRQVMDNQPLALDQMEAGTGEGSLNLGGGFPFKQNIGANKIA